MKFLNKFFEEITYNTYDDFLSQISILFLKARMICLIF